MEKKYVVQKTNQYFRILTLPFLFLLVACSTNNIPPSATITMIPPALHSTLTFTITSSPATITPKPSPTITKTSIPSPTITQTPIPSPTPIPAPTLNLSQKDIFFREAMLGAKNCKWPCFGGIIPGKTSFDEAVQILGTFVKWEKVSSTQGKSWSFKFESEKGWYNGYISRDKKGVLSRIGIETSLTTNILNVSNVLKTYGKPSEIYVSPNPIGPGDVGLLQLVLVYQDQNALLYYEWDEKQIGNYIIAYDSSRTYQTLMALALIGEDNFSWTPEAISNEVTPYNSKPTLIPLHDISNMTLEQFSKAFNPNTSQTIIIPLSAVQ